MVKTDAGFIARPWIGVESEGLSGGDARTVSAAVNTTSAGRCGGGTGRASCGLSGSARAGLPIVSTAAITVRGKRIAVSIA